MEYPLQIAAGELCRLLSAAQHELTVMEQAIRNLIETVYEADHLAALRERACLIAGAEEINVLIAKSPRL